MDKLALLGILFAANALYLGQTLEGGHFSSLINVPALFIVLGGSLGAIMIQVPHSVFRRSLVMFSWIFSPPAVHWQRSIKKIVMWSEVARREPQFGQKWRVTRLPLLWKDPM